MQRKKLLNKIWNALSFLMGTAYSWIILAATVFLIYLYLKKGFESGYAYAETSLVARPDTEVQFVVKLGDTPEDVYNRLEKEGIIGNALLFRLENIIKSADTDYKPGEYVLSSNMKTDTINSILRSDPENTEITIRLLEGYSINNIATYLEANEIIPAETFIWASYNRAYKHRFLEGKTISLHWLEGYLFPDTYRIRSDLSPSQTADSIINKMLDRFVDIYFSTYEQRVSESNLKMDEVITIASIIEKDFPREEERPMGAEVIYNRLSKQMNLNMPSTLLYALNEKVRLDRLTEEDRNVDSPYNTYNKPGLPPGPICNPGEKCIKAALDPGDGNLLYCILINEDTYEHFFTDNEEAYLAALETYNKVYN